MEPADWFTITRNRLGSSRFFLESAFRYRGFLATTVVLLVDVLICVLILLRHGVRLGLWSLWLAGVVYCLVAFWFVALRTHEIAHSLFESERIKELEIGSPLDVALGLASRMTNEGLLFASGIALGCLGALAQVLFSH